MNTKESIRQSYSQVAQAYAGAFWNELERKLFDRILLNWFATQIPAGESVLEIGCGPGEVAGFLTRAGVKCIATDHSAAMLENGRKYFPNVRFEVQDFFHLTYENDTFGGAVGFYAIVNLVLDEIKEVLAEVKRVLKNGGIFVFSFHIFEGEESKEVIDFLDKKIDPLAFYFFKVDDIKSLVEKVGYEILDILIRYPYKDVEYPSKRAYFVIKKP